MILPVRIAMLGRFMVIRGEHKLTRSDWDRQKAATLLQRLALERRLLRDQVIDFLWPDASPNLAPAISTKHCIPCVAFLQQSLVRA